MNENPFRPFCSERCRLIDLDNWLAGRYRFFSPAANGRNEAPGVETEGAAEAEVD